MAIGTYLCRIHQWLGGQWPPRPNIKFCLQLPTYPHFFLLLNFFFFAFPELFAVLLFHFLAEIPKLYKLTRKPEDDH